MQSLKTLLVLIVEEYMWFGVSILSFNLAAPKKLLNKVFRMHLK